LEALGVDTDTNDGVGGDVEAKNEDVLGTKVPAAGLVFVVAMKPKWRIQWNTPPNFGRRAQSRGTGEPELDVQDMACGECGLGMRMKINSQGSVCNWAGHKIVPESRGQEMQIVRREMVQIGPDGDTLIVTGQ
jgi:hypothetical protein